MKLQVLALVATTAVALAGSANAAAALVASYDFNNSLASTFPGGPTLGVVDPTGTSGFVQSSVSGGPAQTVYHVGGATTPALQGGLTFNTTGLINSADGYSVEMTFEFTDPTRDGAWRRILDSQDRQSDAGFYVDPNNHLDVFPSGANNNAFVAGTYRNVVLTVDGSDDVTAYIDGASAFTVSSTSMNLSGSTLGLFIDNVVAGGQGEWSAANIATFNVFDGVLTADQAEAFTGQAFEPPPSGAPEPASWALMLLGFGGLGSVLRRRGRMTATA